MSFYISRNGLSSVIFYFGRKYFLYVCRAERRCAYCSILGPAQKGKQGNRGHGCIFFAPWALKNACWGKLPQTRRLRDKMSRSPAHSAGCCVTLANALVPCFPALPSGRVDDRHYLSPPRSPAFPFARRGTANTEIFSRP